MNYEKKYKEALERARKLYEQGTITNSLAYIFPELKESEGERIKKEIVELIMQPTWKTEKEFHRRKELVAWLEKQGEQKKDICEGCNNYKGCVTCVDGDQWAKITKGKLTTQKFKVGYWIVCEELNTALIVNIDGDRYEVESVDGNKRFPQIDYVDRLFHLWTIKDAKQGDVLADGTTTFIFKDLLSDDTVMSYCDYDTDSGESDAFCPLSVKLMCSKITPATKEQRDTLMKAMADAGWEFDFVKKELKKIEQKTSDSYCREHCKGYQETGKCFSDGKCDAKRKAEQESSAWSKDDEQYLLVCKNALAKYQTTDKWDASIISRWLENKLKSLRTQTKKEKEE